MKKKKRGGGRGGRKRKSSSGRQSTGRGRKRGRGRPRGRGYGGGGDDDYIDSEEEEYQAQLDDEGEDPESRELIDGEMIDLHRTGMTDVPAWYRGSIEKLTSSKVRITMKGPKKKQEIISSRPEPGKWREAFVLKKGDSVEVYISLDGRRSRWNSGIIKKSDIGGGYGGEKKNGKEIATKIHVVTFGGHVGGVDSQFDEENDQWRMPTEKYGSAIGNGKKRQSISKNIIEQNQKMKKNEKRKKRTERRERIGSSSSSSSASSSSSGTSTSFIGASGSTPSSLDISW